MTNRTKKQNALVARSRRRLEAADREIESITAAVEKGFGLPKGALSKKVIAVKINRIQLRVLRAVVCTELKYLALLGPLGMTKSTFDMHLNALFAKFNVRKRSSLSREAALHGFV